MNTCSSDGAGPGERALRTKRDERTIYWAGLGWVGLRGKQHRKRAADVVLRRARVELAGWLAGWLFPRPGATACEPCFPGVMVALEFGLELAWIWVRGKGSSLGWLALALGA